MKKLIGMLLCAGSLSNVAYADDAANLNIKVKGVNQKNTYICIEGNGCFNLYGAMKEGRTFPINSGQIGRIFLLSVLSVNNRAVLQAHYQAIPSSCATSIIVNANQTLTVQGKVVKSANDNTYTIQNMKCSVA